MTDTHSYPLTPSNPQEKRKLHVTQAAIDRLLFIATKDPGARYLSIRIDPGGCSGFQYILSLSAAPAADQFLFTHGTIGVVIDDASLDLMDGTTIDFVQDMVGSAFVMKNDRATVSCGCGNSFTVF